MHGHIYERVIQHDRVCGIIHVAYFSKEMYHPENGECGEHLKSTDQSSRPFRERAFVIINVQNIPSLVVLHFFTDFNFFPWLPENREKLIGLDIIASETKQNFGSRFSLCFKRKPKPT